MEITNKRVLVLGGAGLVGMAICRRMLKESPDEIIVASLTEDESNEACEALKRELQGKTIVTAEWGNIFVRDSLQNLPRNELIENSENRLLMMDDVLGELSDKVLKSSYLYQILMRYRPHVVIDCINSATALAYQDVFTSYREVAKQLSHAKSGKPNSAELISEVEKLLCTLYIPQLIRHVQLLYEGMRRVKSEFYFKIGTSGTGGMGLNIPYTHSEEKPSRVLLSKSSVAGAHSLLLFLMARTPDAPITKEIKPTAAIAWKRIIYGEIHKGKKPVQLYDCPVENALKLGSILKIKDESGAKPLGKKVLESVFIDTGENGIFSNAEFEAITSSGQMEFITPEEIARSVIFELKGGNTGHDIINALDNATMGPTYRAGILRQRALKRMQDLMEENNCPSVAFELLGPPRLSKLLFEGHLFKLAFKTMANVRNATVTEMSKKLEKIISEDKKLRSEIISIGIPILMPNGKQLLRGPTMKIPPYRGEPEFEVTPDNIRKWSYDGWVDLREENMLLWKKRFDGIYEEMYLLADDNTSSEYDRDVSYWLEDDTINTGKVAGWILANEEQGARMKD
ncbi:MAG: short-chain dehydrogenase [Calditrichaeota bacterium]|nr:MAG: short-chain dehydrogenase [Calditrichota bacterium]